MTEKGMTKDEKKIVEGMVHILNQDLCNPFSCGKLSCNECPLRNATMQLELTIQALNNIPIIEG